MTERGRETAKIFLTIFYGIDVGSLEKFRKESVDDEI